MQTTIQLINNALRSLKLTVSFSPKVSMGLFIVTIATSLAPIFQAKILGNIVNKIIETLSTSGSLQAVMTLAFGYAAVWGGVQIANALQLFLDRIWTLENGDALDLLLMKKRTQIDLGHYENPEFQNLMTRAFNRGIWPIFELAEAQPLIFSNLVAIFIASIFASSINPYVYLIIVLSSLPSFYVQFRHGTKVWGIWGEHSERQRKYYSFRQHVTDRAGITQIKLLQNATGVLAIITRIITDFKNDQIKADRKRFISAGVASLIAATGFGFALILIIKQVFESGDVGALVFIIGTLAALIGAINSLLSQIALVLERNLYATDLYKILDTESFITKTTHPIPLDLSTAPEIEYRNVSFKYEGRDDWILRNINLTIKPGEKIALVGSNGAGKTTFIKLLARIYDPTEGNIFINGINVREIDPDEWNSYLSVLLQDYLNYDLTVKESIGMGRMSDNPTEEDVQNAAVWSGANEFIEGWEKKYDQQLGKEFEGGIEPSKGQNQKIALARTLFRNGFVVILDEPTAAIDAISEMEIFEKMEEAVRGNTLILITHRFNTTQNVDRIIVIEHGRIEESGSHAELMDKKGVYKKMFEAQAKSFQHQETSSEN